MHLFWKPAISDLIVFNLSYSPPILSSTVLCWKRLRASWVSIYLVRQKTAMPPMADLTANAHFKCN